MGESNCYTRNDGQDKNAACADFRSLASDFEPVTRTNPENVTFRNIASHEQAVVTKQIFENVIFCNITSHRLADVTNQNVENVTMCNIAEH